MLGAMTDRSMRRFSLVWIGQLVSLLGSGLTGFALGVWVYLQTGSVTRFAFISFFGMLPGILLSPIAGTIADRWDRRRLMIFSDLGAGLTTVTIALLFFAGRLEIWHIYIATTAISIANAFRWPTYTAIVPSLVPKEGLGRANGMIQMAHAIGQIGAPFISGVLIGIIDLSGILLIDFITFLFAITTLLMVQIPQPEAPATAGAERSSWRSEVAYGLTYLLARPGLFSLLLLFAVTNLFMAMVGVLVTPMLLSFTSPAGLGTAMSIGGAGMLVSSLVMSVWSGPKRRIYGVLGFLMAEGLALMIAGLRPSVVVFTIGAFSYFFSFPFMNGWSTAILQTKIAPNVLGRVFALAGMIGQATMPLGYLIAGPLADRVFEPLMAPGQPLAASVGQVIGTGAGRGIGLIFIVVGFLTIVVAAAGFVYPRIRLLDTEIPDAIGDTPPAVVELEMPNLAAADGGL